MEREGIPNSRINFFMQENKLRLISQLTYKFYECFCATNGRWHLKKIMNVSGKMTELTRNLFLNLTKILNPVDLHIEKQESTHPIRSSV